MLGTILAVLIFSITGLGIYVAFKERLGKVGSTLSSGLGAFSGLVLDKLTGYSWVLGLALTGHLPAILFVIGHLVLIGVLVYNTIKFKKAIM